MTDLWEGLSQAFWMVVMLDPDLVEITLQSFRVTLTALLIACVIALPLGALIAIRRFRFRRLTIGVLNALMGLPPVVVGLIVYVLLSRSGPFGVFGLLFTPTAMIIAQTIIIVPLIASIAHQAIRDLWSDYHDLLISLGATRSQKIVTLIWDARRALLTAVAGRFRARHWRGRRDHGGWRQHRPCDAGSDHRHRAGDQPGRFCPGPGPGFCSDRSGHSGEPGDALAGRNRTRGAVVMEMFPLRLDAAEVRSRGKRLIGPIDLELSGVGVTVVIGPNGSGKTSFLRMLHGITRLSHGAITWSCPEPAARAQQAFVFQTPVVLRRSVLDNLAYPLRLQGLARKPARARARGWADRIGLGHALDRPATRLSGGERQKLTLARALIRNPRLLFLDEPCAALDGAATREIEAILVAAAAAGTRIIMSTHNLGQARRLGTEIVFLLDGRVHEVGPAHEFLDHPKTPEAGQFLRGDIVE